MAMGGGDHPPPTTPPDLTPAADFLRDHEKFVIASHRGPDGDAIGSLLALAAVLESLGKTVVRHGCDSVPYPFLFLEGADRITVSLPATDDFCVVLVDCAEPSRAGQRLARFAEGRPLLVVDHHLVGAVTTATLLSDPSAASVGLLVERLAERLGVPLSLGMAEAIYTTVISDTGSFHYSNTTPDALRCAARMVERGVDPWRVASHLYEAEPLARVKLLGEVLATLEISPDGLCATLLVTQKMLQRYGAGEDLLDGFINYGRRVQGVEIAVLIREIRPDLHKCSLRSRGRVNVAGVASRFGGGGHHNAAGCQLSGDYLTVRRTIVEAVRQELASCTAC